MDCFSHIAKEPLIFTAFTLYTPKITNTISTNPISNKNKKLLLKGKKIKRGRFDSSEYNNLTDSSIKKGCLSILFLQMDRQPYFCARNNNAK